jgi:hypothetical protein
MYLSHLYITAIAQSHVLSRFLILLGVTDDPEYDRATVSMKLYKLGLHGHLFEHAIFAGTQQCGLTIEMRLLMRLGSGLYVLIFLFILAPWSFPPLVDRHVSGSHAR